MDIKSIALYLPQYHPIPENDEWWGKGFTEWTNVTKAKPLFKNHVQPKLPSDLGFYDLRVEEARQAQVDLAKTYGIYGFCYWHYWFAGKRIIERPFNEMVASKTNDFPFCISWANQTWSGTWHGLSNKKVLIEQTYPGKDDYEKHFYSLLDSFIDKRYIEVNGKKLVFIFRPMDMPSPALFTSTWQKLAIENGLNGIHFVGMHMPADWDFARYGYDAFTEVGPLFHKIKNYNFINHLIYKILKYDFDELKRKYLKIPNKIPYKNYVNRYDESLKKVNEYPMIYCNWDNTPRSGTDGWLFDGSTPKLFEKLCTKAFVATEIKPNEEKIVLLKSWNEWAEGNYMEPDRLFGHNYLKAFQNALKEYKNN